jgi:hypothetical protein
MIAIAQPYLILFKEYYSIVGFAIQKPGKMNGVIKVILNICI